MRGWRKNKSKLIDWGNYDYIISLMLIGGIQNAIGNFRSKNWEGVHKEA